MTKETKKKISETLRGRKQSITHRQNVSNALMGHIYHPHKSAESKEHSLAALRIHQFKLGINQRLGKKHSEETKRKIGDSNRIALRGKRLSILTKKKMALSRAKYMESHPSRYTNSRSETLFLNELEKTYGVQIERNFRIEDKVFDGRYKDTLFEIDGEYWHSLPKNQMNDEYKAVLALKNNFKLYRIVVNTVDDIDDAITHHHQLLKETFIG